MTDNTGVVMPAVMFVLFVLYFEWGEATHTSAPETTT